MRDPAVDLIDAHLHLQDPRLEKEQSSILAALRSIGVTWWGVNGTDPDDWEEVARLARECREVFPFFGVHPWKVRSVDESWEENLKKKLEEFPNAGVGEIGVDKWIRDPEISVQREVFGRQLSLAQRERRPVAIHCLQAWGHLEEVLKDSEFDGPFLVHSFGGPREVVSSLCDRGAFFSLSGYFFREDKKKKLEVFRCIPRDRILLETDAPDMLPPQELRSYSVFSDSGNDLLNHPGNIEGIYEAYAHFRGGSQKEIASEMKENLRCWLNLSFRNPREAPGPR